MRNACIEKRSSRHEQSTNPRATTQNRTHRSAHVAGQPKGIGPAWTQETKSKNVCKCPKALSSIPNASAGAHSVDSAYLYPPFLSHICHPACPELREKCSEGPAFSPLARVAPSLQGGIFPLVCVVIPNPGCPFLANVGEGSAVLLSLPPVH